MPREDTQFKPGNKAAAVQKGTKKTKTKVKELLGLSNPDRKKRLEERMDELMTEFLDGKDKRAKEAVFKELLKYMHPQKKESKIEMKGEIKFVVNPKIAGNIPEE